MTLKRVTGTLDALTSRLLAVGARGRPEGSAARGALAKLLQEQASLPDAMAKATYDGNLERLTALRFRGNDLPGEILIAKVAALNEQLAELEVGLPELLRELDEATAAERETLARIQEARIANEYAVGRGSKARGVLSNRNAAIRRAREDLEATLAQMAGHLVRDVP